MMDLNVEYCAMMPADSVSHMHLIHQLKELLQHLEMKIVFL